jgi:four helix bundle protein
LATFRRFEDIEAWQKARELTREIYRGSKNGPFSRDFPLRDQIRKASVSIMSNIAEGFERSGRKEFLQFLAVAKGSAGEVRSQLYVASEEGYLTDDESARLHSLALETSSMIGVLMKYLRQSELKGAKYRHP